MYDSKASQHPQEGKAGIFTSRLKAPSPAVPNLFNSEKVQPGKGPQTGHGGNQENILDPATQGSADPKY